MDNTNTLATIELDGIDGRGEIFACQEVIDGQSLWVIKVRMPDGTIQDASIAPMESLDDVNQAIEDSWGGGPWDLQFAD